MDGDLQMKANLFPDTLKQLRKAQGYTQEDVSAALGVVRQTYSHYETGERTPNAEILYKLAGFYNISIDDIMLLTINIDRNISYDAPKPTASSEELARYIEYFSAPINKRKFKYFNNQEKELLYYFQNLSKEDKLEIIELTKIKSKKTRNNI
jgi:transcriptional regulator with XRE-family HTH domain